MKKSDILNGHTSFETAKRVENYPYGGLRTTIFYWIETLKNKGDRFCSCTIDPKNGRINKPKKSTYSPFIFLYLNEKGHVDHSSIRAYETEKIKENIQFIVDIVGVENVSPVQQLNLRFDIYGTIRAGYIWVLVKYSDETKPLYTAWMKETLKHIRESEFKDMVNFEDAPEQDQPNESAKFVTTETFIIGGNR